MLKQWKTTLLTPSKALKWWEVILLVIAAIAVLWCAVLSLRQQQLAQKLVRLHVVANSDSAEDQALKLQVRDAVLEQAAWLLAGVTEMAQAEQALAEHLEELNQTATSVIATQGHTYSVETGLETVHFPTKTYESFALPAGDYRALRVVIGAGDGQNWWCVVFPTLCVPATSEWMDTAASGGMTGEEVALMEGQETEYIVKFKCLEWLDWLKERLR